MDQKDAIKGLRAGSSIESASRQMALIDSFNQTHDDGQKRRQQQSQDMDQKDIQWKFSECFPLLFVFGLPHRAPVPEKYLTRKVLVDRAKSPVTTLSSRVDNDPKWKVAVGVHPKHAGDFDHQQLGQLVDLLTSSPNVRALGEVGLDRTTPSHTWARQEEVLRKVITIPTDDQILMLHLRGSKGDPYGSDVQGTYFSVNSLVKGFDRWQKEGLRSIPQNRLLLETDSPHLSPGGGGINTSHRIGDVAMLVAQARGVPVEEVLRCSTSNARAIYRIP
ncbi:uncharacterized metal-dependent hydrolase YcfH-like [Haliotis cracherodii]|uniref:uncharacterized metal-dependent hydrolase YcfH-like n=1 Tax=Haliotis cracherodii TaxID=6455 RepID=UPI0039E8808F